MNPYAPSADDYGNQEVYGSNSGGFMSGYP
jgi:hypothetical protein